MKFHLAIFSVVSFYAVGLIYGQESTASDGSISPYIVQGEDAEDNAYPYQVSLRYDNAHRCGAVIVTTRYIVTAAHCVTQTRGFIFRRTFPIAASRLSVRVGSTLLNSGGNVVRVSRNRPHPRYSRRTYANDIALLQLSSALTFGDSIRAIALATSRPATGAEVTAIGWGNTSTGGSLSERLKFLKMSVVAESTCRSRTRLPSSAVICLQSNSTSGTCQGDSGGAAIYENTLIGLTSFGIGNRCANSNPEGFAYVPTYVSWISLYSDL